MPRLFNPELFNSEGLFNTEWHVIFETVTPTLAELLRRHHAPVSRVTVLSAVGGNVLATFTPLDGSASMELTRDTHRAASFTAADPDGTLTDELLVEGRVLLIERGAYLGAVPQMAALITGIITEDGVKLASGVVSVACESRLSLLNRPWPAQLTFPVGMRLMALGRSVAESAGYGTDDALYDLEDQGRTLAVARTVEAGADMLSDLIAIFNDNGLDLWDTGAGVMVSRQTPDLLSAEIAWTFNPFQPGTVVLSHDTKRTGQQGAINRVRVTGRGPDGYPIYGEARITDPSHPLYWTPDLDLPQFVDRPGASTVDACLAVARQLLLDGSLASETHTFTASAVPLLMEQGRPVVSLGPDRLRLDTVSMPLRKGGMGLTAATVRALS